VSPTILPCYSAWAQIQKIILDNIRKGVIYLMINIFLQAFLFFPLFFLDFLCCILLAQLECAVNCFCFFTCSADLQNAIENENYAVAAELRDQISELEAESLAASAKALVYENAQYAFRLGQKVKHKTFGM
jgi:hypothetical protein